MPFGKYRGWPLDELPDTYLDWLASLDNLREPLRSAVYREQDRRQDYDHSAPTLMRLDTVVADALVTAGYRALALRHHPDHGGDTRTMQKINGTVEALRELMALRSRP